MTKLGAVFSKHLREARDSLGVTQDEFADHLEIGRRTLQRYETENKLPPTKALNHILKKLGKSETEFFADKELSLVSESEDKSLLLAEMLNKMAQLDLKNLRDLERYLDVIYKGYTNPKKIMKKA